jgi:hypothetical protein
MKNKLPLIIVIVLVLCVVCGGVIYFVWQSANNKLTEITNELTTTQTVENSANITNSPGNNTACTLLTADMAKQILGTEVKTESSSDVGCTYSTANLDLSSFGVLTIIVTKSTPITAKDQFNQAKTLSYSGQTESVTGLNVDEAYYATNLMQLSILKGDSWIIISGTADTFSSEKDLAIAAAKLVFK